MRKRREEEENRGYNDIYKKIRTKGVPNYLKGKKSKKIGTELQDIEVIAK